MIYLGTTTNDYDLVNKKYVDSKCNKYLPISGGFMTGFIKIDPGGGSVIELNADGTLRASGSIYEGGQALSSKYAAVGHSHSEYAAVDHTHSGYAPAGHVHTEYAVASHTHSGYAATSHTHSEYAKVASANTYNGEQKFQNSSYCPTVTDSASGVGCAFKGSRGLVNELLVDSIIMTGTTNQTLDFYVYGATSNGQMSGLSRVAYIDSNGWYRGTAEKATHDGAGNAITTTYATKAQLSGYSTTSHTHSYLPLSGGTLTGALTFANGTMNTVGDDVQIGDQNVAGTLCIKGTNGNTAIRFMPYSGSTAGTITWDGSSFVLSNNLTGQNITGTGLRASAVSNYEIAPTRIAVLDGNGWICYRTPAQILSDIGAAASGHSHSNYAASGHNHDSVYSKLGHTHSEYAAASHNHGRLYNDDGVGYVNITLSGGAYYFKPGEGHNTRTVYCGGANFRWNTVYSVNAVNVSSDLRVKTDISTNMDLYVKMLDRIEPITYIRTNSPENTRHVGYGAQHVESALHEVGLTNDDFAGLSKDWDPETGSYIYGLAYEEFIPVLHARQNRDRAELETQLQTTKAELQATNAKLDAVLMQLAELKKLIN